MPIHPDAPGCCAMVTGGVGGYSSCRQPVAWAGLAFGRRAFAYAEHQDLLKRSVVYGAAEHVAELKRRIAHWAAGPQTKR